MISATKKPHLFHQNGGIRLPSLKGDPSIKFLDYYEARSHFYFFWEYIVNLFIKENNICVAAGFKFEHMPLEWWEM
jgi:hypothetical protein